MTPTTRRNLDRLLRPRHIAIIGGGDAEVVMGECARIGYAGALWPVNPKRDTIADHACFKRVEDLPQAPDAVFLAIPRDAAVETLGRLSSMGSGGAVCYSAGFGETGAEGMAAESALVAAAGDMALVGPNCYGVINFIDRVALWPFARGGSSPGYGAAIITQSGMLSSDLTMSQRSFPFAYMVSAGNQAGLSLEDFVDYFARRDEVRAIGLHVEGLKDIAAFSEAALFALRRGIPVVALKAGASRIGAALTVSHTGSLSGTDDLYDALFERLGVIRVDNPAQLLETLKFICVAGVPKGNRVAGFTCSGGGATMMADRGEKIGLDFPVPSATARAALERALPEIATVSNPLDYTTPIWGKTHRVRAVVEAMLEDSFDAAVALQDYPLPGIDESKPFYLNDATAFIAATGKIGLPSAICSTLPENLDVETREFLIANEVAPMQGINETLDAVAQAAWHHARRGEILARPPGRMQSGAGVEGTQLTEWQGKQFLRDAGLPVPDGRLVRGEAAADAAAAMGFPVALKMVGEKLLHKTEAGAVRVGLGSANAVDAAVRQMRRDVAAVDAAAITELFLVERMVGPPVGELLVGLRNDPHFGPAMTLASGGLLVELVGDATTLLLPAHETELGRALDRLKVSRLLDGYRGRPGVDKSMVVAQLASLAAVMLENLHRVAEIEINPLFVMADGCSAVDVLMRGLASGFDD